MAEAGQPAVVAAPVAAPERIAALDVARGAALFGILSVNMAYFSQPIQALIAGPREWTGPLDRAAAWLIMFLAEGKFYTLFSFLFGLGLAIQMTRAEARGIPFVPLSIRRLLVLLVFGLVHAYFIWIGDILVTYALLGFALLLFRNQRPRTLLVWAGAFLGVLVLMMVAGGASFELARAVPGAGTEIDRAMAQAAAEYASQAEQAERVYREGSFLEITAQRARDLNVLYPNLIFTAPSVLTMFLLGLYAGKRGVVQDIQAHRPLIRRVMGWGLGLGLPLNLFYAVTMLEGSRMNLIGFSGAGQIAQTVGGPLLALGYAAGLTLLSRGDPWRRWLAPVAAVGRLALSNYLLQSLVATTIFYGYGFGFFGQVGPAGGLALTVAIYLAQLPLSVWWLRHFQFGPAEWLWRTLTYARRQPLRATPTEVVAERRDGGEP